MQFTKWRYKSGHLPAEKPEDFMKDMEQGSLIQLTLGSCPLIEEDINVGDALYEAQGGCWCSEYTRDECAAEV